MNGARTFGRRGTGEDADLAAKRAAFIAAERARAGQPREDARPSAAGVPSSPIFVREKSLGTAYVLWFFFGGFGAHRFYLGFPVSGGIQLILWPTCYMLIIAGFFGALFPLTIGGLWILADAFLIPGLRRQANDKARQSAAAYAFA